MRKSNIGDDNDEKSSNIPSSHTKLNKNDTGKEEANITPTLSLIAITGISQPQNLILFGHIKNTKVMVLVDSWSTHNFIESRVEKNLNIFIYLP